MNGSIPYARLQHHFQSTNKILRTIFLRISRGAVANDRPLVRFDVGVQIEPFDVPVETQVHLGTVVRPRAELHRTVLPIVGKPSGRTRVNWREGARERILPDIDLTG